MTSRVVVLRIDLAWKCQRRLRVCVGREIRAMIHLVNLVTCERRVTRHEEMTPRCGYQTGDNPNQVVVHITWISQCCGRGCHDCRNLSKSA